MKPCLILLYLLTAACTAKESGLPPKPAEIAIRGVDVSYLPAVRASGIALYNRQNQAEDILLTLKKAGTNMIRLRLWNRPKEPGSDFATVKAIADECKSLGLKVLLTVHYSDDWADPAKQNKPEAWKNCSISQLNDSISAYTRTIMSAIQPEYIQIGNEINNGLLWPEGSLSNLATMKSFLKTAITAVREVNSSTKVMLHYAGMENAAEFYEKFTELDYDLIGLSYYPMWHGKDLNRLQQTLTQLSTKFGKSTMIVETSYPFTLGWNDWTNNVVGLENQILNEFPATPLGQKQFLSKLKSIVQSAPNCLGFCYWGGEWVSFNGKQATNGSTWENQALWDFNNRALPILDDF